MTPKQASRNYIVLLYNLPFLCLIVRWHALLYLVELLFSEKLIASLNAIKYFNFLTQVLCQLQEMVCMAMDYPSNIEKLHLNNNNYSDDLFAHLLRFPNTYIEFNSREHILAYNFFVNIAFKYAKLPTSDSTWAYIISGYTRLLRHTLKRDWNVTRKADLQTLIAKTKNIYIYLCALSNWIYGNNKFILNLCLWKM
jgi:hypothetical protein